MANINKVFLAAVVFAGLLGLSCENPSSSVSGPSSASANISAQFYAYDYSEPYGSDDSRNFYVVTAYQMAVGQKCDVWVESGANVSADDAQAIANEYDKNIEPAIRGAFGITVSLGGGPQMNIMDVGDYYTNRDGKLLLLLLDIKDGYNGGGYIGGLFNPNDFFDNNRSNKTDMIYVDVSPGKIKTDQFYATIAHELQHLIHFMADVQLRTRNNYIVQQDLWIDEGLSLAAEYLYLSRKYAAAAAHNATNRVHWFNISPTIPAGNTFFVWDGMLDDYATAYLFFQWLRIQSGGIQIYRDILASPAVNYQAVTTAAAQMDDSYIDWEKLLRSWFAANYITAATGTYGYKGELNTVPRPASSGSISLRPGEGVYSSSSSISGSNIKFVGLKKDPITVNPGTLTGEKALTFNINTDNSGGAENGQIASILPANETRASRQAAAGSPGPYPIGVRDMLGGRRPDFARGGGLAGSLIDPDGQE